MSKLFTLNISDFTKGFAVAVIAALLTGVQQYASAGTVPTWVQLKTIGLVALGAGVSYIIKNFLTNSEGALLKAEPKPAVYSSSAPK